MMPAATRRKAVMPDAPILSALLAVFDGDEADPEFEADPDVEPDGEVAEGAAEDDP
jgi:hypothetical protein